MAEKFLVEAVNDALHVEMERDDTVMVLGEDVGRAGGVFRATAGLRDRFGPDRCVDMPLAEAGLMGGAVGLCMAGWRPVCEMQYDAFSYPALDQLITHVGRYRWRTGGKMAFPLVVRLVGGGYKSSAAQHGQVLEAWFAHVPGLLLAVPSTPADAKGLMKTAIRLNDPVIFLEHKSLYLETGEVPDGDDHLVSFGSAAIRREGADVTIVAWSKMVGLALEAARQLEEEGIDVEVVDPRTLVPLDEGAILASVAKTGRLVVVQEAPRRAGFAAEIVATVCERASDHLRAPVRRIAGRDVPLPMAPNLERQVLPQVSWIVDAVRETVAAGASAVP